MGDDVVSPADPRYPTLVRGLNQRWVGHPRYVELCDSPAAVVGALGRALAEGARPTVRSGGHCYEDFVSANTGGVILDLSPMTGVVRDARSRFGILAGTHLGEAYEQLYKRWGVTIPGGSCFPVGAGGHVCGGGYGLLSRLHGLTVDHLSAVDVVVLDGSVPRLVSVSRDSADPAERLLFWAHQGGGGGNFGVVVTYWFDDPPVAPAEATLVTWAWDWADLTKETFTELVRRYGEFLELNSGVDSPYAGLFALLHLTNHSAGQIVLTVQYVGDEPQLVDEFGHALFDGLPAPVRQRVPAGYHQVTPASTERVTMPWWFVTEALGGSGPPQRGKYKSAYLKRAFPQRQLDVIWKWLNQPGYPNPQSLLQVDSYGCRVNAVPSDATPIPQRSSIMKLQYQAYWTHPGEDAANLRWIRGFYDEMYGEWGPMPDDVVDGAYVNYPDVDLVKWPRLYYGENYPGLQAAKQRWDPGNVFHHEQSIRLPGDGPG